MNSFTILFIFADHTILELKKYFVYYTHEYHEEQIRKYKQYYK